MASADVCSVGSASLDLVLQTTEPLKSPCSVRQKPLYHSPKMVNLVDHAIGNIMADLLTYCTFQRLDLVAQPRLVVWHTGHFPVV